MNPRDKVFIVTGGMSGLGRGVVDAALESGAYVAAFDLTGTETPDLEENSRFVYHCVDVADEEAVSTAMQRVFEQFGHIDVAVNCAGIGLGARTHGRDGPHDYGAFKRVIDVNLNGTFNVIRLAVSYMAKNDPDPETGERGVIVNTSSGAAYDGQMGQAAYAASKAGIVGMTLPIARDLSRMGVRINTIAPGPFDTPLMKILPEEVRQSLIERTEFPKRLGYPSEFADLVLHMVKNTYLNGETVRLDAATRMPPR